MRISLLFLFNFAYKIFSMKPRFLEFDLLRSVAVLWIVAIWHLTNYCEPSSFFYQGIVYSKSCREFTLIMLSLFMFMSGLFTKIHCENLIKETKAFYIKKFLRFYPLYIISAISLYFIPKYITSMTFFSTVKSLHLSFFGFANLWNLAPATLWFMDLLLFMILLTPLTFLKSNKKWLLILSIYGILYLTHKIFNLLDYRVLMYMPFYFLGIYLTPSQFLEYCKKYGFYFLILGIILMLIPTKILIVKLISRLLFIIAIGKVASTIVEYCKSNKIWTLLSIISYSSMCAYFFHRQIYSIGLEFSIPLSVLPFLIFIISYFIQKAYDKLLAKVKL